MTVSLFTSLLRPIGRPVLQPAAAAWQYRLLQCDGQFVDVAGHNTADVDCSAVSINNSKFGTRRSVTLLHIDIDAGRSERSSRRASFDALSWVEQGFTSHTTHFRSFRRRYRHHQPQTHLHLWARIAILQEDSVSAHKALAVHVSSSLGRPPDSSWRRRPGRPRGSTRSGGTPARLLPITGDRHKGKVIDVEKGRPRWLLDDDGDGRVTAASARIIAPSSFRPRFEPRPATAISQLAQQALWPVVGLVNYATRTEQFVWRDIVPTEVASWCYMERSIYRNTRFPFPWE